MPIAGTFLSLSMHSRAPPATKFLQSAHKLAIARFHLQQCAFVQRPRPTFQRQRLIAITPANVTSKRRGGSVISVAPGAPTYFSERDCRRSHPHSCDVDNNNKKEVRRLSPDTHRRFRSARRCIPAHPLVFFLSFVIVLGATPLTLKARALEAVTSPRGGRRSPPRADAPLGCAREGGVQTIEKCVRRRSNKECGARA